MSDSNEFDGGPAFPLQDASTWQAHGMSKRELFAIKALPSVLEQFWRGVNEGEFGCPEGWRDGVAGDACLQADALLRALAEPRPEPAPKFPEFNVYGASSDEKDALRTLHTRTWFEQLPDAIRSYVTDAVDAIARADAGEDDIPF